MKPIEKLSAPYGLCPMCRTMLTKGQEDEVKCRRCGWIYKKNET